MRRYIQELFDLTSHVSIIGPYTRTRAAILNGNKLYDLSNNDIKEQNFQTPLSFKISEILISSFPNTIVWAFSQLLFPYDLDIEYRILSLIIPMIIPLVVLFDSMIISLGSLKFRDVKLHNIFRSSRAYLYFHGSESIFSHTIFSLTVGFLFQSNDLGVPGYELRRFDAVFGYHLYLDAFLFFLLFIAALANTIAVMHIHKNFFLVRKKIFSVNGYNIKSDGLNAALYLKYGLTHLIFVPIFILLVAIILVFISFSAGFILRAFGIS